MGKGKDLETVKTASTDQQILKGAIMNTLNRYYCRETLNLNCTVVTPMFLGNARQEAEWRAAPFKSLLRYWWRITQHSLSAHAELYKNECNLFGSASEKDEKIGGKSLIHVQVISNDKTSDFDMTKQILSINHPELKNERNPDGKVNPILYLAGIGLMRSKNKDIKVEHSYFPAGSTFNWKIGYPKDSEDMLQQILTLINAFGAIGGRCRNGWGSFKIESKLIPDKKVQSSLLKDKLTINWEKGFEKDYPNCLGKDDDKLLLWKTECQDSWEDVMRSLAEAYVGVRAVEIKGIPKLNVGVGKLDERHLLGVPLTHHLIKNLDRHASPLRFIVKQRKAEDKFEGFVLHLPFLFSADNNKDWQIDVWKKVHSKLDTLLTPVTNYEEIL